MSRYYAINQEQMGPVSEEELRNLAASGTVTTETLVWQEGMEDWEALGQCRKVRKVLGLLSDSSTEAGSGDSGSMMQQTRAAVASETIAVSTVVAGGENYDF